MHMHGYIYLYMGSLGVLGGSIIDLSSFVSFVSGLPRLEGAID